MFDSVILIISVVFQQTLFLLCVLYCCVAPLCVNTWIFFVTTCYEKQNLTQFCKGSKETFICLGTFFCNKNQMFYLLLAQNPYSLPWIYFLLFLFLFVLFICINLSGFKFLHCDGCSSGFNFPLEHLCQYFYDCSPSLCCRTKYTHVSQPALSWVSFISRLLFPVVCECSRLTCRLLNGVSPRALRLWSRDHRRRVSLSTIFPGLIAAEVSLRS